MDVKSAKKPFVAISSRLIQYNDWTIVTHIKFAKFHHYTPNNKNVMMGGGGGTLPSSGL